MADELEPIALTLATADESAFAAALGASVQRFGFAVISDHGIPEGLIAAAYAETAAFFALPEAVKRAYHIPGGAGQRGYTPFGVEAAKGETAVDLKEFWHIGRDLPSGHPFGAIMPANIWPNAAPGFRQHLSALYAALEGVGREVLRGIALYLQLPRETLVNATQDGDSILRLLHYPPVPAGSQGVRAAAHEDINTITLLLGAEEPGLQLLDRNGHWRNITPPTGALVINVGDMLQRLTNHILPSTTHRVINPEPDRAGRSRYSMPFFLHFAPDYEIRTLPTCISSDNPNRYPVPITARAYLLERLREINLA